MTLGPWDLDDLPENMKSLPVHLKTGLPVPRVNTFDFQDYDFTTINGELSLELSRRKLCAMCATRMHHEVAFLGGPQSSTTRAYSDPPMHVECAEAATQLCPHITRETMKRATDNHTRDDVLTPDEMTLVKPRAWVMHVVAEDDYQITVRGTDNERYVVYVPGKALYTRTWIYQDGKLVETGEIMNRSCYHSDESFFDAMTGKYHLIRVVENEPGYEVCRGYETLAEAQDTALELNNNDGLTADDVLDIRVSSMTAGKV